MAWGRSYSRYDSIYPVYVSVAERKLRAQKDAEKKLKKGEKLSPIKLMGKMIAGTFWGKSWCENLERYSDFENRLPRGRSYVRNGSVIDLDIGKGVVNAQVSGSSLYKIKISIKELSASKWEAIKSACSGHIGTMVELLQGKFSKNIMEMICRKGEGMFPEPSEIEMDCSCPDWATMCKHVAAVLYGVGARLDEKPELIFLLRGVDHLELISHAAAGGGLTDKETAAIADSELADVFGIEIEKSASEKEDGKIAKSAAKAPKTTRPPSSVKLKAKNKVKPRKKTAVRKDVKKKGGISHGKKKARTSR